MKLEPILTEKSLEDAKRGFYTFWVGRNLGKSEIKNFISKIFDVHVKTVRTINYKGGTRKNFRGQKVREKAVKKAVVELNEKEKIAIFEEKSK